ncbi:CTLH/CRA C-terminal to lish motif domain-containing protein [Obelidium mucronatum]|nr:CTLH/CRA C-terminal to lish motif domain-containing protein [Obelidium mucronatum]
MISDAGLDASSSTPVDDSSLVLRALIREYLAHGCFGATLEAFAAESGDGGDVEMGDAAAGARRSLKDAVLRGRLDGALAAVGAGACGQVTQAARVTQATDAAFLLHSQVFVELVRAGDAGAALRFAEEELTQYALLDQKYLDSLQDLVPLLAYADPHSSPVAHYLSQQRREEVANNLNGFLLAQQNLPSTTSLERLVSQITLVRELLSEPVSLKDKKTNASANVKVATVYPKWDLTSFLEQTTTNSA